MDLITQFWMLIIFGIIAFLIKKYYGYDAQEAYLAIGFLTLLVSFLYIIIPALIQKNLDLMLERLINWLINFLPGVIIGDVAGAFVAKITGE